MSESIEHAPRGSPVAPNDGDPPHPVWGVYHPILEHQLVEICNLSTSLRLAMDVESLATNVVRGLAQGWDQKTLYKWITPPVCKPEHRAIYKALASWVFATQGVLSHVYPPVLSRGAVEADLTDLDAPTWGPPVSQDSILLGLANELFDNILKYLPAQDVNDLRLSCRESRGKSFDFWSKTFFTTRQFMVDGYSLQTLLNISRHPELRHTLTHLIIGVDEIDTRDTLSFIHRQHSTNPTMVATMFRYWRDAAAAQQALLHTGRAIELLSQALSNLAELKAVSVSGSMNSRYVPSHPDLFHYPDLGLRSYGAWAYQMQRRDLLEFEPNSYGFVDKVFGCVLNSLVRSSPTKLLSLRTNLDNDRFIPHLRDEAFYLPPFAPFPAEKFTFLAKITKLHLDVNLESHLMPRIWMPPDHRHTFDPCNTSLQQLLCACHGLVSLSLSVYSRPYYIKHCGFTAWLAETADNPSDTPVHWPFLRNLELKGLKMSPATLQNIFVKFDTVRTATLENITLVECFVDHPPIPHNSQEPLENLWETFFRGSAAVLSNLDSLELNHLEIGRYREHPDYGAIQIKDKDFGGIVFVPEEPKVGATPSLTIRMTNFRLEALETLAEQTWFLSDWERAKDAAEAAAEDAAEASALMED